MNMMIYHDYPDNYGNSVQGLGHVGTFRKFGIISGHGQGDFMKGGCNQATLSNTAEETADLLDSLITCKWMYCSAFNLHTMMCSQ